MHCYVRMRPLCFTSALVITVLWVSAPLAAEQFKYLDADIIFQETASGQSEAIKRATASPYSHVGIVYYDKGTPYVFEAVQPVKRSSLASFIRRSVGGRYVVKRLKNRDAELDAAKLSRMRAAGKKFVGKNYDWTFGWSDERIYCSELVWKIYRNGAGIELAPLKKLKEFNLGDRVVQKKMKERYGKNIPYEEPVVSPGQLFESPILETVFEKR